MRHSVPTVRVRWIVGASMQHNQFALGAMRVDGVRWLRVPNDSGKKDDR